VNGEVGAVKTDLAGTKTALDSTRTELQAQLKKVTGDLGITNALSPPTEKNWTSCGSAANAPTRSSR